MVSAIGIDIGGTHIRAARITAAGEIVARAKTASVANPREVLERMASLIAEVDAPDVTGIGIGVPGRVDFAKARVLSGGYVDLSSVPLAAEIGARLNRPVVIDNDCSMALIAEAARGAARGKANVVMLTIGTGIGGAILESGKVLRGRRTAGQLGHIRVDPHGLKCLCGGRGCVETVSSGTALGRHIAAAGLSKGTTAAELLARRAEGDDTARAVLDAWAKPLRIAIDSLVSTLDPDVVVLGGGLGREAVSALEGVAGSPSWYESSVVSAELGDDAGVIGAGLAALTGVSAALRPKRSVLVNGVPASGKSTVARGLSQLTGWPVLALDTVKNPFLEEIEGVDRPFNRKLGKASYKAIFSIIRDAPEGTTVIIDAWFGFQPREQLEALLAMAGISETAEVWCHAPPEVVGARYAARIDSRPPGHPGADYVAELIILAGRAEPVRLGPMISVDTTQEQDMHKLHDWLKGDLGWADIPFLSS